MLADAGSIPAASTIIVPRPQGRGIFPPGGDRVLAPVGWGVTGVNGLSTTGRRRKDLARTTPSGQGSSTCSICLWRKSTAERTRDTT